ncbi:MAG: hypothetical protein GXY41_06935 [Phycisphaerae bacterium]|nr:hypothetical protein [Phycisphaerae bacterium]
MCKWNVSSLVCILLSGVFSSLIACGPYFPSSYLAAGDNTLLQAPGFSLFDEINRIPFDKPTEFQAVQYGNPRQQSIQVDCQELRLALALQGYAPEAVESVVQEYQRLRAAIEQHSENARDLPDNATQQPEFSVGQLPEQLPQEFKLYLEGVMYYRSSQPDMAVQAWTKLLALPPTQRQFRSTWAAYMLGNVFKDDLDDACGWYQFVRQLAREGFRDSIGLAAASYGQEAACYLQEGSYDEAIELYMYQRQTGDRSAMPSLKLVASAIFTQCSQETLVSLVRTPLTRQTLIAFTLAYRFSGYSKADDLPPHRLLRAIEAAGLEAVENADRLAMIAYAAGDFDRAQRWLAAAEPDSPLIRHVRAKLLLRAGRLDEAAADLAFIARQSGQADTLTLYVKENQVVDIYGINSELGSVYFSQKLYTQAADALVRGGNWMDAAYILERVLTPEELQAYVDTHWPASVSIEPVNDNPYARKPLSAVRHLLARRLTRLGRVDAAKPYYPQELQDIFADYVSGLTIGDDQSQPNRRRADALWQSAWLMRHHGMELIGFELDPDWAIYGGNFHLGDFLENRMQRTEDNTLNVIDVDEIDRALREPAIPDKRFHYRYIASELARQAVELMPDEDPETARRLCLAGIWHKDRDIDYADWFYKSLVRRCRTTALGDEADRIRWFPKIADTLMPPHQ